jgi:hypothetical protein
VWCQLQIHCFFVTRRSLLQSNGVVALELEHSLRKKRQECRFYYPLVALELSLEHSLRKKRQECRFYYPLVALELEL